MNTVQCLMALQIQSFIHNNLLTIAITTPLTEDQTN